MRNVRSGPYPPHHPAGVREMHAAQGLGARSLSARSIVTAPRFRRRLAPTRPVVRLRPVALAVAAGWAGYCGNEYADESYMARVQVEHDAEKWVPGSALREARCTIRHLA